MNLNLNQKNALVCGSTQGIGKASAIALAELGANVTLIARNEAKLKRVLAELPNTYQNHNYIVADFQNPIELGEKVSKSLRTIGTFHILVNNTGGPGAGPIFSAKIDEFEDAFTQHLKCNHILVQTVVPGMKESDFGRIINVISTSVKQPLDGLGVIYGILTNTFMTFTGKLRNSISKKPKVTRCSWNIYSGRQRYWFTIVFTFGFSKSL